MPHTSLYPLRFEPMFQYRLWGGRHLGSWSRTPLPNDVPIGESWLLSDREEMPSRVAEGALKGVTISELMSRYPVEMLGSMASHFKRFPLLLKLLDVKEMLSVQVHPSDTDKALLPMGEMGKTEGWYFLEAEPSAKVYAGLKSGVDADDLRSLSPDTVDDCIASFAPHHGDALLLNAGTVHALGKGAVVFEVQENSDVTFRLYDWDHIDPKTGERRQLQVDKALACIDFQKGQVLPVSPAPESRSPVLRERVFDCSHFRMWRIRSHSPFAVGSDHSVRIAVCVEGGGSLHSGDVAYPMMQGDVMMIPAAVGSCTFRPDGIAEVLEVAAPEAA